MINMERYNEILRHETFCSLLERLNILEEKRKFCGHDLRHLLDVARIAYIMSLEQKKDIEKDLIYAAGLLHDLGRVEEYESGKEHHIESARIAGNIMKDCGYLQEEIETVKEAIMGHRKDDNTNELAVLLYQADKLSRNCFCCKAYEECKWDEDRKNKGVV